MSIVSEIVDAIGKLVEETVIDFERSQYIWDTTRNAESKNKQYYAIRPGSASFVSGTCRTITLEQNFQLELGDVIKNRGDKDLAMNEKVNGLYQAHESIYREIMRNNFNIGRVQVVNGLDIEAPEVDNDNKVCRIVATYTIRYRTE